jgi:hypothetical protein
MSNIIKVEFNNDDVMNPSDLVDYMFKYGLSTGTERDSLMVDKFSGSKTVSMELPLLEDITLELQSQYQQLGDIFPIAAKIQNILGALQSLGGTASSISNIFTYEMWKSTDPLIINFKTILYTVTNPFLDVWYPSVLISSQSIITKYNKFGGKIAYKLPGLSLGGASRAQVERQGGKKISTTGLEGEEKKRAEATNKIIENQRKAREAEAEQFGTTRYQKVVAVHIPGILYIDTATIVSAKPTYSKQTAIVNGKPFPIWCELDIQIKSVSPAHTGFFIDALKN